MTHFKPQRILERSMDYDQIRRHDYYLIYSIEGDKAIVHRMFHDLQDLDRTLR